MSERRVGDFSVGTYEEAMTAPADVAALTDEQCDAIGATISRPGAPYAPTDTSRALIRAGHASLQANVPAVEHTNQCENWMTPRPGQGWRTCICGADDKPEVAALQRENAGLLGRCGLAEARVTRYEARVAELERTGRAIRDSLEDGLETTEEMEADWSKRDRELIRAFDAAIAARKP